MVFRTLALGAAMLGALGVSSAAVAQIDPDDTGAGTKLGMAQQNNSGQTGTVTLFRRGPKATLVVVRLASEARGRQEPAHIHRGRACDSIDPKPAFGLAPVVNGVSRTLVQAPEAKLLSGNYVVNVHASTTNIDHYVSCGELYT
ncbi:MAG: hypothetical protein IAI50_14910 [Candidatus Eremiobacteraeota bacterium]|nr:hypothetical protein [Candidatus Eremiobacteraeota bacterium]